MCVLKFRKHCSWISLVQANHQKAAYLDHIALAFYRFAFTELQLPLYFGFPWSPLQETFIWNPLLYLLWMYYWGYLYISHWLLKLKSHGRNFFLKSKCSAHLYFLYRMDFLKENMHTIKTMKLFAFCLNCYWTHGQFAFQVNWDLMANIYAFYFSMYNA